MKVIEWRTVKKKVNDLIPYEKNPRILTEEMKQKLIRSIEKFNLAEIPAINKNLTVLAGHQRLKVLKLLGRGGELIDVRIPNRILTEEEVKEYNVTSNVSSGAWNIEILKTEFSDIDLKSLGLDVDKLYIPDDLVEADFVFPILDTTDQLEKQEPPEPLENPISKAGDLYELISPQKNITHRVMCGDSTIPDDIEKLLNRQQLIIMVTDPPYGVEYDPNWRATALNGSIASTGTVLNDDKFDWTVTWALYNPQVAYVWHADRFASKVQKSLEDNEYEIKAQIIWNKNSLVLSRGDYHWKHEPCWYAVKKGMNHNWQGARDQSTVWDIQNLTARSVIEAEGQTGHGTQKPLECMKRPIENNSKRGDVVADPFLGSGSTLIACEQTGRQCYGMELGEKWVDVEVKRWINFMTDNNLEFELHRNGEKIDSQEFKKVK